VLFEVESVELLLVESVTIGCANTLLANAITNTLANILLFNIYF
jgi:hypothetical protein